MSHLYSLQYAHEEDSKDPLKAYREQFVFPQHNGKNALYFTGNSLGLQAKKAKMYLLEELEDWGKFGVEGHLDARRPWLSYHELFTSALADIVGAKESEVVAMNGLTTNLHLMMVSFYRPEGKRTKILCEGKAFPSDQYALKSQLRFHGLKAEDHLIELEPNAETELIDEEDIYRIIESQGDEIALLMIGGMNYYTGQLFDISGISKAAKDKGIIVGWDLAHGAGNIPLQLHDWDVDFAAWCGYKYLNSGPGGISGAFIHEKHHGQKDIPRFEGWWGHDKKERFLMGDEFDPIPTAEAWQLSNAPVFSMTPLLASLELFQEVGMKALREKSVRLTAYLEEVIKAVGENTGVELKLITPKNPQKRGAQLSVIVSSKGKSVFDAITKEGVIADWREPSVIRLAPVPMYNSFEDVYQFGKVFEKALKEN